MISFLRQLLFENLVLLLIVEAAAMAVALAAARRSEGARGRYVLAGAMLACIGLLVLQHAVQTDRERIQATIEQIAAALDEGDVAAVGEHLDRDFRDRGLGRQEWLADLRLRLQRWHIDEASVGGFTVRIEGDRATAVFQGSCDWKHGNESQNGVMSTWKLGMVRREDGWKLDRVLSAKFGPGGILDYASILQY
jgi:hypothetical protein